MRNWKVWMRKSLRCEICLWAVSLEIYVLLTNIWSKSVKYMSRVVRVFIIFHVFFSKFVAINSWWRIEKIQLLSFCNSIKTFFNNCNQWSTKLTPSMVMVGMKVTSGFNLCVISPICLRILVPLSDVTQLDIFPQFSPCFSTHCGENI